MSEWAVPDSLYADSVTGHWRVLQFCVIHLINNNKSIFKAQNLDYSKHMYTLMHTHTHTHRSTHDHTSILIINTKLNIHCLKQAANARETWNE